MPLELSLQYGTLVNMIADKGGGYMGKHHHNNDKLEKSAFLKNETIQRIIQLTKLPTFMLAVSCVAMFVTLLMKRLPPLITISDPAHECTFLQVAALEQEKIKSLIRAKTKNFALFGGSEKLGIELLEENPNIASVSCSLDSNRKLRLVITGNSNQPHQVNITHNQGPKESVMQVAKQETFHKNLPQQKHTVSSFSNIPFDELLSTSASSHLEEDFISDHFTPEITSHKTTPTLSSKNSDSFNQETLVSGKRNSL